MSTSMGMTPLEGLVMATRAGSVDPGILIAAQRDHGLDPHELEDVLERRRRVHRRIGEHAASVRAGIVRRLASLGVPPVDDLSVESEAMLIGGPPAVLVVIAREDVVIARELSTLIG